MKIPYSENAEAEKRFKIGQKNLYEKLTEQERNQYVDATILKQAYKERQSKISNVIHICNLITIIMVIAWLMFNVSWGASIGLIAVIVGLLFSAHRFHLGKKMKGQDKILNSIENK